MKTPLLKTILLMSCLTLGALPANAVLIDTFSDGADSISGGAGQSSTMTGLTSAIGGERIINISSSFGGSAEITVDTTLDQLQVSRTAGSGNNFIFYEQVAGASLIPNGEEAVLFDVDQVTGDMVLNFTVVDTNGDSSFGRIFNPGLGKNTLPFTDFTTSSADLTSVDRIILNVTISNVGVGSIAIDQISTVVPEPSSLAMLGLGALLVAWRLRR